MDEFEINGNKYDKSVISGKEIFEKFDLMWHSLFLLLFSNLAMLFESVLMYPLLLASFQSKFV